VNDDAELRKRFAALRDEELARIPGFEQVVRRVRLGPYMGLRALTVSAALVVVAIVTVPHIFREPTPVPEVVVPTLAQWRAPTDFLLNTPGRDVLHTIPQIGEPLSDEFTLRPTGQEPQT
jgi:hypothetical protein